MTTATRQKEFLLEQKGNMYFIRLEGGGQVPKALDGMWTNSTIAKQHISAFLEKEAKASAPKKASAK